MCRILSYLGKPILVEELLYKPDNSFIKQSYHPKYMSHLLNLAGFGIAAWDNTSHNPSFPHLYKTPQLPFYDENLKNLASKISPHCLLAHLRGVSYHDKQIISNQNVHPFVFSHSNVALAHNGSLSNFALMRYDLLEYVTADYRKDITGTTDSEWIYAVFLSQLAKPVGNYETEEIAKALIETLKILQRVRAKRNIKINSPVNLFITNGEFIAATRFVLDYGWHAPDSPSTTHSGYHSLWYTYGESYGFYDNEYKMKGSQIKSSIIIASEPLTEDTTTWLEVPEYTLIIARHETNEIKIVSQDINI
ncbi:class II glutamine amidotransferase [Legionella cardiaca]|uniref:Class II glutamine amidotransferase n=1 Tax=Legionella cardiaca TaxID=1071983 RepID=A0ABY8AMZ8_9GAMM|nr:class II glutamine amidotransferase [Legionella cardiaca]WED42035.1 class II glutamine amidotransferase [Legionella cardiaca]